MVYIGIDVSSDKFNVSILYPDSSKSIDLSSRQSRKGFEKFLSSISSKLTLIQRRTQ